MPELSIKMSRNDDTELLTSLIDIYNFVILWMNDYITTLSKDLGVAKDIIIELRSKDSTINYLSKKLDIAKKCLSEVEKDKTKKIVIPRSGSEEMELEMTDATSLEDVDMLGATSEKDSEKVSYLCLCLMMIMSLISITAHT